MKKKKTRGGCELSMIVLRVFYFLLKTRYKGILNGGVDSLFNKNTLSFVLFYCCTSIACRI